MFGFLLNKTCGIIPLSQYLDYQDKKKNLQISFIRVLLWVLDFERESFMHNCEDGRCRIGEAQIQAHFHPKLCG